MWYNTRTSRICSHGIGMFSISFSTACGMYFRALHSSNITNNNYTFRLLQRVGKSYLAGNYCIQPNFLSVKTHTLHFLLPVHPLNIIIIIIIITICGLIVCLLQLLVIGVLQSSKHGKPS